MKNRKELMRAVKKEKARKKRIMDFLVENEGNYYTVAEINDELDLKCAGRLVRDMRGLKKEGYVKWYSFKQFQVGIEKIEIPINPDEGRSYCEYADYYGYLNETPIEDR